MRKHPLSPHERMPGAPAMPGAAAGPAPHPLLRLQQAVGNRAAAGAMDAPALESAEAAAAPVRRPAGAPVPCRGCVGGGGGPVVRR